MLFYVMEKPESESLYVLTGQLIKIIKETGRPAFLVMRAMINLYGTPVNYYRIGTRSGSSKNSLWPLMLEKDYISIGWSELGDLTQYGQEDSEIRNSLKEPFEKLYPNVPQTVSREINEIRFFKTIKENDIVVAGDGMQTLGIGRVLGGYEYHEGLEFPHIRQVEWVYTEQTQLPEAKEGLRTTVISYKNVDNILTIRELLAKGATEPKNTVVIKPIERPLLPLEGPIKKIDSILERQK